MTKQKKTTVAQNVQQPGEIVTETKEIVSETEDILPVKTEKEKKLTVVIPYLKSKAQGKELLYAVRSIAKNFKEDFNLVVIGDREDWFSDEIIHIECPAISDNPQIDVFRKIATALGNTFVSDGFVWTNDDIYFVSPVTLADIQVLKTEGKLKSAGNNSVYDRNRTRTIELLKENNLPLGNFATHTPVFLEKEKVATLLDANFEAIEQGVLFSSLYFNTFFNRHSTIELDHTRDVWKLRIVSKDPNPEVFRKYIANKKFLNNAESGWCKLLQDFLERKFGTPCRFERQQEQGSDSKKNGI